MKIKYILFPLFALTLFACYDVNVPSAKKRETIRHLRPVFEPADSIPASGIDTMVVKVPFPHFPMMDSLTIKFLSSEGVFIENNKNEFSTSELRNENGTYFVRARLRSSTNVGKYQMTVELPNERVKITVPFSFSQSYADAITTDKNKFSVESTETDEIQLTASLRSGKGYPHTGTEVEFIVADTISSKTSKWFRALTKTNATGQASVYFSPGGLVGYTGEVKYKVVTKGKNNPKLEIGGVFDIVEYTP